MMTLPLRTGMDSTKEAIIQPTAGTSAPLTARMAHARQQTRHQQRSAERQGSQRHRPRRPAVLEAADRALHRAEHEQHGVNAAGD